MRPNTAVHAGDHFIEHQGVAAEQRVDGHPHRGSATLGRFGGLEIGVWEMTPGVMRDVEADEMFVAISGVARVEFADGTAPLTLKAGDVVRLAEGAETIWTVTETLRKVYLAGST